MNQNNRFIFIKVVIAVVILSCGDLKAQDYTIAYNGRSFIGYASDETPLKTEWKVSKVVKGKSQVVHAYKPISSKDELRKNLRKIPSVFRNAPYNKEEAFVDTLYSAYQRAKTVKDLPLGQFPWTQFALGLAFSEDQNQPDQVLFQVTHANGQTYPCVLVSDGEKFNTSALKPRSISNEGKADHQIVLKWMLDLEVMDLVLSASVYRSVKERESRLEEISTLLGMEANSDRITITVKDTTIEEAGIYTYIVQTHDRYGRIGLPSDPVDFYFLTSSNAPILTTLEAVGLEDMPAIQVNWKVTYPQELNGVSLERSRYPEGPFKSVAILPSRDTTFIDFVEEMMEAWYYRLVLIDKFDRNHWSPLVAPAISTFRYNVSPPLFTEAQPQGKGVLLNWETGDVDVRGYYVYRREPGTSSQWEQMSPLLLHTGIPGTMSYLDTVNLKGHIRYEYAIHAESMTYNLSLPSNIKAARPEIEVPVEPIQGLQVLGMDDGTFKLSWEDLMPLELYLYYYQLGSRKLTGESFEWSSETIPADQNFTFLPQMEPDREYTVRAVNIFGDKGSHGTPVRLPSHLAYVKGPEYLMGRALEGNSMILRWNAKHLEGVSHFVLYQVKEDGDQIPVREIPADQAEISMQWPEGGTTYWAIQAVYRDGKTSALSELLQIDLED